MSSDRLRQLLATLHRELGDAKSIDAESRRLMGALIKDIDRVLDTSPAAPQPPLRSWSISTTVGSTSSTRSRSVAIS